MDGTCHRCHAALPDYREVRAGGDEERPLFCRHCGAPQIMLPEYLRAEVGGGQTTGAVPPPRPQKVDWQAAVLCAVPVAVVTGALAIAGLALPVASFLNTVCVLCGSGIVLGLYRARRPLSRIDGRVGLRVGLLTGVLMVAAIATGVAATGVVVRFGMHGMTEFDKNFDVSQVKNLDVWDQMMAGSVDAATRQGIRQEQMSWMAIPEFRAGSALSAGALTSVLVVMMTTLGGGFAGLMQRRRRELQSR